MINEKLTMILVGILLAVISIVPFAIPYAYLPLPKFYSEIISVICGVLLFAVAIMTRKVLRFSPAAIASFAFAVFILIQPLFVHIYFKGNAYYVAILFFIMGLAATAISSIIDDNAQNRHKIMLILCWSLVLSATIQSIIAYLQYTGKAVNFPGLIAISNETDGSNIFGNIGQPNQFTDFISIGVVALCYLFLIGQLNIIVFIAYALLFALVITFTARRGVLLYFMIMLFIAGWKLLSQRKHPVNAPLMKKIAIILAGFFIGLIVVELALPKVAALLSSHPESVTTGVERLSANAISQSTYRRFYEWYKAIVLFAEHPLFGVGWYQYPREGIYIMLTERFMYIPANVKLYTHCHNSLFNIMAESGIIGTFITIIYGIGYSLYLLLKKVNTAESLFAVLLMVPILTHSLLEYPLWYTYFQVLLMIFLAFAPAKYSFKLNMATRSIGALVVALIMVVAYNANQVNNQLMFYYQVPTDYDDYANNIAELRRFVDTNSMWALPATLVLDNYIMPGSPTTNNTLTPQEQLKYVDLLAWTMPYPGSLFKQVIIHKMLGDDQGANRYANVLVHAYPFFQQQFIQQLSVNPNFADVIKTMQAFKYEDKSDLSKLLSKGKESNAGNE